MPTEPLPMFMVVETSHQIVLPTVQMMGKITGAPVTVSITVTGTNDAPIASGDTIIVSLGGTATTLDNGESSVLANDSDPDGDVLTATLVSSPSFGTFTLNPWWNL